MEDVPAGEACEAGGVKLSVGTDENGDGALSADEVEAEEFVCNGQTGSTGAPGEDAAPLPVHVEGNYVISNSIDLELFKEVQEIGGDLLVASDGLSDITLPALTTVGGNLEVLSSEGMTSVSLPALTSVGGYLSFAQNPQLEDVSLGVLVSVGDSLGFHENDSLAALSLPETLETVGGAVLIGGNPLLGTVAFPATFVEVGGYVAVGENPALTSMDFGGLTTIGGGFMVYGHPVLTGLLAPDLSQVSGDFDVYSNPQLCQSTVAAIRAGATVEGGTTTTGNNEGC